MKTLTRPTPPAARRGRHRLSSGRKYYVARGFLIALAICLALYGGLAFLIWAVTR